MKKYSGTVMYIGIMIAIFGLLLFGATSAATNLVTQPSSIPLGVLVKDIAQTASDFSMGLLAVGALLLALGLYMRRWSD